MDDHCYMIAETGALKCSHCGQEYTPNLPAPIKVMVAMIEAFSESHKDCEPRSKDETI